MYAMYETRNVKSKIRFQSALFNGRSLTDSTFKTSTIPRSCVCCFLQTFNSETSVDCSRFTRKLNSTTYTTLFYQYYNNEQTTTDRARAFYMRFVTKCGCGVCVCGVIKRNSLFCCESSLCVLLIPLPTP